MLLLPHGRLPIPPLRRIRIGNIPPLLSLVIDFVAYSAYSFVSETVTSVTSLSAGANRTFSPSPSPIDPSPSPFSGLDRLDRLSPSPSPGSDEFFLNALYSLVRLPARDILCTISFDCWALTAQIEIQGLHQKGGAPLPPPARLLRPLSSRKIHFPQLSGVAEQAAHLSQVFFLNVPSPLPPQWVGTQPTYPQVEDSLLKRRTRTFTRYQAAHSFTLYGGNPPPPPAA